MRDRPCFSPATGNRHDHYVVIAAGPEWICTDPRAPFRRQHRPAVRPVREAISQDVIHVVPHPLVDHRPLARRLWPS